MGKFQAKYRDFGNNARIMAELRQRPEIAAIQG
jgi:hypothetical protein